MADPTINDSQKYYLSNIASSPGLIPVAVFGKLSALGLVSKVERPQGVYGQRGYTYARATDKGRRLVS